MPYPTKSDVRERICWSADVDSSPALLKTALQIKGLKRIKVDRAHVDANGFGVFDYLNEFGFDIFDDAKVSEIPTKLASVAKTHCRHRPWMLNCMADSASGGPLEADREQLEGLKQFADVCHEYSVRPCAVSVLTSTTQDFGSLKYGKSIEEQVELYADLLVDCGFTDMVCSPQEAGIIRAQRRFNELSLVTPGIKRGGGNNPDQARSATPAEAFYAGADLLVIGRDLTKGDPAQNLDDIVAEVLAA